ncbi:MAG: tetratricopeptide repeat protein [Planctomycetota bacterium]|jgi:tetratricopeptide (TPR) repeat protein
MAETTPNTEEEEAVELPMDALTRWFEGVLKQWQTIVGLLVVALVVGVLYGYVQETQEEAELAAWKAAAAARNHSNREELAERLEKVIKDHSGVDALFFIETELMQAYFDSNKPVKARKVAERVLKRSPGHPFALQVRADMARLLEHEGQWQEAIVEYDKVLTARREYLVPEATLGKARCLEQDRKLDEAKSLYREILQQQEWPLRIQKAARLSLMALAAGTVSVEKKDEAKEAKTPVVLPASSGK